MFQSDDAQNEFLSDPKKGLGEDVYDDDNAKVASSNMKPSDILKKAAKNNGKDLSTQEVDKLMERSLRRQSTAGVPSK